MATADEPGQLSRLESIAPCPFQTAKEIRKTSHEPQQLFSGNGFYLKTKSKREKKRPTTIRAVSLKPVVLFV
ncbi:hypothetical protein GRAN_4576 [Granulicella sibirica]|uniref:Uncharacterized protein n=1 Tax=Granulicella sibirica TaxID=2479048 RepID=A0A4Q0SWI1_9BACT|nr:hypothetical protein GRAN_4576 [Granulicella sibirica]